MSNKVFISYSKADVTFEAWLKLHLVQEGFDIWEDKNEIKPGDNVRKKIEDGINASSAIVVILSKIQFYQIG